MSNALAISATTLTLQSLLTGATADVTVLPMDRAREHKQEGEWLNLFLYQTVVSAAWRNADIPRQVRSGEAGHPPLGLNLHYLITAYSEDEARAHQILGRALSILHDHALLDGTEIEQVTVTSGALPESDLHLQLERVRLTPIPLTLEEISKLWSGFQTQYRLSAAYEAAVVLIESVRPRRSPLPVLRQGPEDRGPTAVTGGTPLLEAALPPDGLPAVALGALLTLKGQNLGNIRAVRFRNVRLPDPIERAPEPGGSATERQVRLPSGSPAISEWTPGFYTLSVVTGLGATLEWTSNEVPLAVAPAIVLSPTTAAAGDIDLTITCTPRLRAGQPVLVLFGDRQLAPSAITTPGDAGQPSTIEVTVPAVEAGEYVVRLRVDGADSVPFRLGGTPPLLAFDPAQKVVVT